MGMGIVGALPVASGKEITITICQSLPGKRTIEVDYLSLNAAVKRIASEGQE